MVEREQARTSSCRRRRCRRQRHGRKRLLHRPGPEPTPAGLAGPARGAARLERARTAADRKPDFDQQRRRELPDAARGLPARRAQGRALREAGPSPLRWEQLAVACRISADPVPPLGALRVRAWLANSQDYVLSAGRRQILADHGPSRPTELDDQGLSGVRHLPRLIQRTGHRRASRRGRRSGSVVLPGASKT